MNLLSVVIPCYNEEDALSFFYKAIDGVSKKMIGVDFEFIFVDDGSRDNTLEKLKKISKKDDRVRYISFSRNFGKEAAIYAGFEKSLGNYVAMMDADMQDPPYLLEEMYATLQTEEYDNVATRRVTRKGEPLIRSFFARQFYKIINKISNADIVDGARDYRLMNRKMVNAVLSLKEYNRFSKGIFGWVGFRTKWLPYENVERVAGETKWSFWKLFVYSLEGIVAFSTIPLSIASIIGMICCLFSTVFIVVIILKTLIWGDPVSGWPSIACLILFIGGIQLFSIGVLGKYISRTYLEVKNRPLFIVREQI